MLKWLLNLDVVIAALWLNLSIFLFPYLVSKLWVRLNLPQSRIWVTVFAAAWILAAYSFLQSASILGNIDCERRTHHRCEEYEGYEG